MKRICCLDWEGTWEGADNSFVVLVPEKVFEGFNQDTLHDGSRFIAHHPKARAIMVSDLIRLWEYVRKAGEAGRTRHLFDQLPASIVGKLRG